MNTTMETEMKTDRVIKQYRIDQLSRGELAELRESSLLKSKLRLIGNGATAHWRAVVAACDEFLKKQVGE
jgi:hypothetical protein